MKRVVVSMALALFSSVVFAAPKDLPVTSVKGSPAFSSMEEAAIAAFAPLVRPFADSEFGGAIVERAGKFYYTEAVSIGESAALGFQLALRKGDKFVGMYHTHPAPSLTTELSRKLVQQFSNYDVRLARQMDIVLFLAEELGGTLRIYDPKAKHVASRSFEGRKLAELSELYDGQVFATVTDR